MTHERKQLIGAFAAMIFVGASWGANMPVSKVLLSHFDLMPMVALRTATAAIVLGGLVWMLEGRRSLNIDIGWLRFWLLGLIMGAFFCIYVLGLQFSNPISASAFGVAGPLVSAVVVRLVSGQRFDPGFGIALLLTIAGGAILVAGSIMGSGSMTLGGGEIVVLLSNGLWTLYSLKAQAWFDRASQLHRTYVASLSSMGWMWLITTILILAGRSASPFGVTDAWVWTQFFAVALFASTLGGFFWNVGASRLGVAIASLWVNLVPFFAVLWSMAYGFMPNVYQIVGGLVALSGVVYMQWRKLSLAPR